MMNLTDQSVVYSECPIDPIVDSVKRVRVRLNINVLPRNPINDHLEFTQVLLTININIFVSLLISVLSLLYQTFPIIAATISYSCVSLRLMMWNDSW